MLSARTWLTGLAIRLMIGLMVGLMLGLAILALSCVGRDAAAPQDAVEGGRSQAAESRTPAGETFTLQLLHASDMDGATGALGNVESFSALLDGFREQFPGNTLVVSSGDNYIPGPRYFAAGDAAAAPVLGVPGNGRGDIALLNAMGFQASALGNHELDRGTAEFAEAIRSEAGAGRVYPGAGFPYLSSNLVFDTDERLAGLVAPDGQDALASGAGLAGSAVVTFENVAPYPARDRNGRPGSAFSAGSERVGIVGATTPSLRSITAAGGITVLPPANSGSREGEGEEGEGRGGREQGLGAPALDHAPFNPPGADALAGIIQKEVDLLVGQGINKIVLLAHMQRLDIEMALASMLTGVDIIVAGGSNTILADETDRLWPGDRAAGGYPLVFQSPQGGGGAGSDGGRAGSDEAQPVLLVNTGPDYRYLGRLLVEFDEDGVVLLESIDPHESGVYATDRAENADSQRPFRPSAGYGATFSEKEGQGFAGQPIKQVSRIVRSLRSVLRERDGNIIGKTGVYLSGDRGDVRTQETNLGNLTAGANLWAARQVDPEAAVSLKNGGGIRSPIGMIVQPPGTTDPSEAVYLPPQANRDSGKETGDISRFDIEGALRFNNGLVIIPLTARQLVAVVEHSIGFDGVGEATAGRFPQVGGMRFSFDPSAPPGKRVRSLAIVDGGGAATGRVTGREMGPAAGRVTGREMDPVTGRVTGREMDPATGRVTGREMDPVTGRVTGREMGPVTGRVTGRDMDPVTGRAAGREMDPVTGRVAGREMDPATGRVIDREMDPVTGRVIDRVVEDGSLAGDPERIIKVVTLDFLANGGDGYPFPVPARGRVDLRGEAGQFNAPDPAFPDTNGNGVIDGPVLSGPGLANFAPPGTEQDALAEYLRHFHSDTPFNQSETPPLHDRRIQNLSLPAKTDTVFK